MSKELIAITKISTKTVLGEVKKLVRDGKLKNGQNIMRCYGIATGFRTGSTNYGEFVAFQGDFVAINMITGDQFTAPEYFGDRKFTDALEKRLSANPGAEVEFAVDVSIAVGDDYPTGYAYVTRPVLENSINRLADLRARVEALPAPTAEPKKSAK